MVKAAENSYPTVPKVVGNARIAKNLEEIADRLERQGNNPFRVRAYRRGAEVVRQCRRPLEELVAEGGVEALQQLPGIGESLAAAIENIVHARPIPLLQELRAGERPERLFTTVADIGPTLAKRIYETLGVRTLGELEAACWDGRLARVDGMGRKRIRAVRESLAGRLRQPDRREPALPHPPADEPEVGELLAIDHQYRELAGRDRLLRVAPRRFNPEGRAWLPILHTTRDGRHYTAMYSNTVRAHEFGALGDWVVIYRDDIKPGGIWTVITSHYGRLKGRRVVRGREEECEALYGSGS